MGCIPLREDEVPKRNGRSGDSCGGGGAGGLHGEPVLELLDVVGAPTPLFGSTHSIIYRQQTTKNIVQMECL